MVNGLRHLEKTASESFYLVKKHLARNIILSLIEVSYLIYMLKNFKMFWPNLSRSCSLFHYGGVYLFIVNV